MLIPNNTSFLKMQENMFGLPVHVTQSYASQWHYGSAQLVEAGEIIKVELQLFEKNSIGQG